MQSNAARAAVAIASVAILVLLFVLLSGGGEDEDPAPVATTGQQAEEPAADDRDGAGGEGPDGGAADRDRREGRARRIPTIMVEGGAPVEGVTELGFRRGERVRFAVRSDLPEEVHVHGYDIYADLRPGRRTEIDFAADLEGIYEVELHGSSAQIAELTIKP
jgi:hypothetical protein